jgi:hypothetical protein
MTSREIQYVSCTDVRDFLWAASMSANPIGGLVVVGGGSVAPRKFGKHRSDARR